MKPITVLFVAIFATFPTFAQKSKATSPATKTVTSIQAKYTCEMHPGVVSSKAGKCPKCGMDLTLPKKEQMKADVTKSYTCPIHPDYVSNNPGTCPKCSSILVVDRTGSKQVKNVYTCSMHPEVVSDKPGKCSICGMDMTEVNSKGKSKKS